MSETEIWHNPMCSKSRETLEILKENGVAPKVMIYKETPPSADEIRAVLAELGLKPRDLIRQNDKAFKALDMADNASDDALIEAMVEHPAIIERPVVRHGGKAALGRPPVSVLELFK